MLLEGVFVKAILAVIFTIVHEWLQNALGRIGVGDIGLAWNVVSIDAPSVPLALMVVADSPTRPRQVENLPNAFCPNQLKPRSLVLLPLPLHVRLIVKHPEALARVLATVFSASGVEHLTTAVALGPVVYTELSALPGESILAPIVTLHLHLDQPREQAQQQNALRPQSHALK